MTNPKLQMARRIADRLAEGEAIDGFADLRHKRRMEGALAAIEECTERAAKLAQGFPLYDNPNDIAFDLRRWRHLED